MDAAAVHQASAEGHALRGVVVAADDEDLGVQPGEAHQEVVEQLHRLRRGDGFVIDVSGDQDGVRRFFTGNPQDFRQNVLLVLQHGEVLDPLPQVEVGQMKQFHMCFSLFQLIVNGEKRPGNRQVSWSSL